MNALVSGVQQANAAGVLTLPDRDIPQQQTQITQDEQVKPNFVPTSNNDYISELPSTDEMIRREAIRNQAFINSDNLFDQLQIPITIGILYFAFQTPKLKELALQKLPSLFINDGNLNTIGSILFSILLF